MPIPRWIVTHFVVVPADCVHAVACELTEPRAVTIDSCVRRQKDDDRLTISFDRLNSFVTEAMVALEYVSLSAGVVTTEFVLSDTAVPQ
jgi:hypothetical protein